MQLDIWLGLLLAAIVLAVGVARLVVRDADRGAADRKHKTTACFATRAELAAAGRVLTATVPAAALPCDWCFPPMHGRKGPCTCTAPCEELPDCAGGDPDAVVTAFLRELFGSDK